MVEDIIQFKISQFENFYELLMTNAPEGYEPWFFPCEKKGKNPSAEAILNIDSSSKGSWHHQSAKLSKEQCIQHLRAGYNLGISARKGDPLIIGDVDTYKYLEQTPKDTLVVKTRKRSGRHFFGWDKDGTAKINLPTDDGEIRSDNQYVLACGSYVPFDLSNKKEREAYDKIPEDSKKDSLIGHYTLHENNPPRPLIYSDFPQFFKDKQNENIKDEAKIKQREEKRSFEGRGKYTDLFNLKVSDIIGLIPANKRSGHPLHESDTDANFSLSKDGSIAHCWRHLVSLNVVQYLCVKSGYASCVDAGTPHKGRGLSKIKGDKKAWEAAYNEAVKINLIKPYVKNASDIFTRTGQADVFEEHQPIFFDRSGMFWMWNHEKKYWQIHDEVDVLNFVQEKTGKDIITSKNRTEIINSLKQTGRKNIPKDIKKTWIQFKDKVFDITTGESFEATPDYFVTNPIDWEVSQDSSTPNMDRIFEEWVGEKYVESLYEILAYSLLPDYPIHRLFCFLGSGLNGKSCFLNLLKKFIGPENTATTELDRLMSSRFEVTRLHKKLICLMGETNFTEMKQTALIKSLTGQDEIAYEYKNKTPFSDSNYAKLIIATNNLPSTTDKTPGWYRRWMIIDFPNSFDEKKEILEDIPDEEYNNLAARCVITLNKLLKKREFTNEGTIEERMKKYEDRSNPIEKFLKIETVEDLDGYITKGQFLKRLNEWFKTNRHREMAENAVGRKMKELGFSINERKHENWMNDGRGGQVRVWDGIKWKE